VSELKLFKIIPKTFSDFGDISIFLNLIERYKQLKKYGSTVILMEI